MLFVVWGYLPLCFGRCYGPKFLHLTPCLSWLLWKLKRWTDWVLGFFPVHVLGCEVVICFLGFKYIWLLITTVFFFSSYIFLTCRLLSICLFFHLYLDVKHLTGNLTRTKLLTLPILFYVSALVRCVILQQRTQYFIQQLRPELECTMTSVPSSLTASIHTMSFNF